MRTVGFLTTPAMKREGETHLQALWQGEVLQPWRHLLQADQPRVHVEHGLPLYGLQPHLRPQQEQTAGISAWDWRQLTLWHCARALPYREVAPAGGGVT